MQKKGKGTAMRRFLRAIDLPEEVDGHVPKLTMLGGSDLMVENHTGILQYGADLVRLMTEEVVIRIVGKSLELTEFGTERVYLRGTISGWMFEEQNGCGIP